MFSKIKEDAFNGNIKLKEYGLAPFTWGNASSFDNENNVLAIKPSGVPYSELTPDKMVIVDLNGNVLEGSLKPSSDTPSHIEIYKAFPVLGGVVHTHSKFATSFAQAGLSIPPLGTTHADFSYGEIPLARALTKDEVETDYEKNTGLAIVSHFKENNIDPLSVPGVLVKSHGVFTFGKNAKDASQNASILEIIAEMAFNTLALNPTASSIDDYLLNKHYFRKHGKNAYYGQN